ncbi:MAG: zinc dependent phospholipase C family protein, partial [Hyphomicrobiaceae bacterium]
MHLLFHVVYGTHANGTHHKLALDALRHLKATDADCWQRVFLRHARLYLEGAEAPDEQFKDFENHVLHPRDGLWGGAPEKVRSWYHHVVEALSAEDWPTAVYCAGVLSHYYTDPLQPFHTAQSEAENNIHRAVEWSIARSYGALRALGVREAGDRLSDAEIELGTGPNWLIELVCRGAERATRHYEKLIAHYDIGRGVVDPPAGLDRIARRIVAEMIRYACLSFAAVLDRAVAEARVHAPETGLAAATLLAALQAPARMAANRSANAREWRAVEAIYDELAATGTVERHLPEEERRVRDRYATEVLAQRAPGPQASQV